MGLMVCEHFLNIRTQKQHGKKLTVGRGPLGGGGPCHGTTGTTGTVINLALCVSSSISR